MMSYRTLEEKFLADYEALEKENEALSAKIEDLERENARLRENFGSLAELIEDDNR